jgi:hypothetical protein
MGVAVHMVDTVTVKCGGQSEWQLRLCHDAGWEAGTSDAVLTWSGLLWMGNPLQHWLTRAQRSGLCTAYLHALGQWVDTDPVRASPHVCGRCGRVSLVLLSLI